ncbi:MAG: 50S ribosomal protein L18 [Flavobacteriales bacterium]|jgi:large subunit ribosomal protein L18|nr:50S ribosomal protein L18 [Flavobacteriales bacterium]|tara:strand:+ start:253 stop:606 length:354 start_codon:yes stop_codon:yes gene_type:complete
MGTKKTLARKRVKRRVRGKIQGTSSCPRLSVFRSNKQIYAQIIDDASGRTLAAAASFGDKEAQSVPKLEQASTVGKMIAEKAKAAGIESVVFDRNGYLYHGRIKTLAEAARAGGLKF